MRGGLQPSATARRRVDLRRVVAEDVAQHRLGVAPGLARSDLGAVLSSEHALDLVRIVVVYLSSIIPADARHLIIVVALLSRVSS